MYIRRLLEKTLKDAIKTFPAVFIGGPRQSGKTTMVKNVLGATHNYVSLDELDIRSFAVEDPRGFLESPQGPLIIDEIQNAPLLLSYIKAEIDRNRKPGNWILTGSQQWALMKGISETLAGRVAVLSLHPFSLDEINKNLQPELSTADAFIDNLKTRNNIFKKTAEQGNWMLEGGYPEVALNKKISKKLWFSSYVQTYLDRDIRGNLKNSNIGDFEKFLRLLAGRTGQLLNLSTLAKEIGITVPTVKSWISLLEANSLIYLLKPYNRNFKKRLIKSPKCYFMDTGLVCYLVGLQDKDHLLNGPMAGALFETACITQFVKRFSALVDPSSLYFWRSVDGIEVDLLIKTGKSITPIEFKLSSTINYQHTQPMRKWMDLAGGISGHGFIICTSKQVGQISDKIFKCHYSLI